MRSPHEFFQPTSTIRSLLRAGKSILLSAPMGSRISALLSDTAAQMAKLPDCHVVKLVLAYSLDGSLDLQSVWGQIANVLKYEPQAKVLTPTDLGILLERYFHEFAEVARVVLLITGVRSGSVQHVYELIGVIHSRQADLLPQNRVLQFMICDHFAVRFHMKRNLPLEESELYLLEKIETPVFEQEEIAAGLARIKDETRSDLDTEAVGKNLFEATGGHYSLLMLAIEYLLSNEFRAGAAFWRNDLGRIFENSDLVKKLRRVLSEDREGVVETAIKYTDGLLQRGLSEPADD